LKAFANARVHVCRQPGAVDDRGRITKQAVVEKIAPGTIFDIDKKKFEELSEFGAVRAATKAEIAALAAEQETEPTQQA